MLRMEPPLKYRKKVIATYHYEGKPEKWTGHAVVQTPAGNSGALAALAELDRRRALHAARMKRYRAKLKAKKANG